MQQGAVPSQVTQGIMPNDFAQQQPQNFYQQSQLPQGQSFNGTPDFVDEFPNL